MADGVSIGIRASLGYQTPRFISKDGNLRNWSTVIEPMLSEKIVWGHVQGTVAVPGPILLLGAGSTPLVPVVPEIFIATCLAADPAFPAAAVNAGVTQTQFDSSCVAHDKYAVNEARSNSTILLILDPKDVITPILYIAAAEKRANLVVGHVSFTASKESNANQNFQFQSFSFISGEPVYETTRRFECLVTEYALQGIFFPEILNTTELLLLTHSTERWKAFTDSLSPQVLLPTSTTDFQHMIVLVAPAPENEETRSLTKTLHLLLLPGEARDSIEEYPPLAMTTSTT